MLKAVARFGFFLQLSTLVLSSVEDECYGRNRVCNSLSSNIPNNYATDFSNFKRICLDQDDAKLKSYYSDGFEGKFLETTETAFSLYSLCHESYPRCRSQGERCFCNQALKNYFEKQSYLSFVKCRETTGLDKRKEQGQKFFQLSLDYTLFGEFCNIDKLVADSKWVNYYWNSINSESAKRQIRDYCQESAKLKLNPKPNRSNFVPSSYCRRVGDVLKQFQFVGQRARQINSKSTYFGVGLIAFCGACECCDLGSGSTDVTNPVTVPSITETTFCIGDSIYCSLF